MHRIRLWPAVLVGLTLFLSGCATDPGTTPSTDAPSTVPSPIATLDGSAGGETTPALCGSEKAADATTTAVAQLPPAFADPDNMNVEWDATGAKTDGYDPCAQLSWVVVSVERGTVSSPAQVLLFHLGEYVGPASERAYGFLPEVRRINDRTVEVTYIYPQADEAYADASGRAVVTFTWDDDTELVSATGQFPPS